MTRELKFSQAILEAQDQCLAQNPNVYLMGLGVPDPKGIFGTTLGLAEKFGKERVFDTPTSENGMTGVAIGSCLVGKRPILVHQRLDFSLLAFDQIVNAAAKWHYMFDGKMKVPLVIRMILGRGWGQGPQHSQSLQSLFAHIPGLKVVMPSTPYDAKGLLIASIEDDNPVIFLEHRWLFNRAGPVPKECYRIPLGQATTIKQGKDLTIVATSYLTHEAVCAAQYLSQDGIETEIIDLRTIKPLDFASILNSVQKTGRLLVVDGAWRTLSIAAEIIAETAEKGWRFLKAPPQRICFPDVPCPTSFALAKYFYPGVLAIVNTARNMFELDPKNPEELGLDQTLPLDIPEASFNGPF